MRKIIHFIPVVIIFIAVACAVTPFPTFPNIKKHYLVEVKDEEINPVVKSLIENENEIPKMQTTEVARCVLFDVVSARPYKIKFNSIVAMKECHLVGGYKPNDIQQILNFIDDVYVWAEDRKKCFK